MGKNFFSIIIVVLFGIIAGFSLLHKGLPPTHDGEYHVVRYYLFNEAINDGNLYPRWAAHLNNNFGVPLFTFVYPLPNYIASTLHLFGISFIDSFKLQMFSAILIGAIFFYLWSKEFWGKLGGIVSSVFYTFSPYHFVDIYIRGSVGEVWALAFFPAFLWAYTRFVKSKQKIFFILSSLFLSLIIFSHNILALMFFFFALSYVVFFIFQAKEKKSLIFNTSCVILIGIGLSSIFWLPAILESNLVKGLEIFDVTKHFPDLYELLIPSWGSGFSGGDSRDHLSFQVGLANLLAFFLSFAALFFCFRKNKKCVAVIVFFQIWFVIIFLLMLKISHPIWESIPLMNYFQFPWRLLSLEILIVSFLSGSIAFAIKSYFLNKIKAAGVIVSACLMSFAFLLGIGYSRPAHYLYRDDNYYTSRSNFIDGTNSPGNVFNTVFFNTRLKKEKEKITFLKGKGSIEKKEIRTESYVFKIHTDSSSKIRVNTAYFPGWEVKANKNKIKTHLDDNGLFYFYLSTGSHDVKIKFTNTPIRNIAIFLSYISFTIVSILFIKLLFVTIKK